MRKKKALKNLISNLLWQFVTIIAGLIVPNLIIRTYGSDVNGLIISVTQFLSYISLLESGIGPVIKHELYKPIAQKNKDEILNILYSGQKFFKKIAAFFVIYIVILCIIYPILIANNYPYIFTIGLIIIISLSTLFEYYFGLNYSLFLDANQENYITSVFRIITTIFSTVIIVVMILFEFDIILVKGISALIFILRPILLNIYVSKKYEIKLSSTNCKAKSLTSRWSALSLHVATVVHNSTDVAILSIFTNFLEVSVYSIYANVTKALSSITQSVYTSVESAFGDMIAKNEEKNLNNKYSEYEFFYYLFLTILFSSTLILILPFVSIYTNNVIDTNYIRPLFALFIILSELVTSIRFPYRRLCFSAGKFKELNFASWLEVIINIVLSIVFVFNFGIVGVAIGTLISITVNLIITISISSKKILNRKSYETIKKIFLMIVNIIINVLIMKDFIGIIPNSFYDFILLGIKVGIISTLITIIYNLIVLNKNSIASIKKIHHFIKRRVNNESTSK